MRTKDCHFDDSNVQDLWQLVKDPEEFWGDLGRQSRHLLKRLLEHSMVSWREEHVAAGWHERAPQTRRDLCNGFYTRKSWPTVLGALEHVRVPRCRQGGLSAQMKAKVGDGIDQVSEQVVDMFVAGVSTRRVGELLERIIGLSVSAGSVSRLAKELSSQVRAFHSRALEDCYAYLFVDGLYLRARGQKESPTRRGRKYRVRKRIVLVAYGVSLRGEKELIAFKVVDSESAQACTQFLWNLYHRGLGGAKLRLIISDRSGGLTAAAEEVYPGVAKQGCWFHKMGNVLRQVRKCDQPACVDGLRKVYCASNRSSAVGAFGRWRRLWEGKYPKAVACVDKDLDRLLAFYAMPQAHWKMLRTTNAIERCLREVRRRTYSIGTFLDDESISRIIYALFAYMNSKRARRICKEFREHPLLAASRRAPRIRLSSHSTITHKT